jgi:hypothetical protein
MEQLFSTTGGEKSSRRGCANTHTRISRGIDDDFPAGSGVGRAEKAAEAGVDAGAARALRRRGAKIGSQDGGAKINHETYECRGTHERKRRVALAKVQTTLKAPS